MTNDLWAKAACAAFTLLTLIAGWGLKKVYDLDVRCARIETKIEIWTTPLGGGAANATYLLAGEKGGDPYRTIEFLQRAALKAANEIKRGNDSGAMKTLRFALEESGLVCTEEKYRIECR